MAALIFASKVALSSLPNINLNALLIILATGWISYLLIWPVLVIAVMALRKNHHTVIWAVLAGVYGLLFGPLMYIVYFTVTGGWEGFLPMWIAGIPYDLLHAVSNFFTVLFLFAPLSKVMGRFADSYN